MSGRSLQTRAGWRNCGAGGLKGISGLCAVMHGDSRACIQTDMASTANLNVNREGKGAHFYNWHWLFGGSSCSMHG